MMGKIVLTLTYKTVVSLLHQTTLKLRKMKTVKIQNKKTGAYSIAEYLQNRKGNLQYCVFGKFLNDKEFDRTYKVIEIF